MGMIRAVTFDVGGTLAKGGLDRELYQSSIAELLRRLGFDAELDELRARIKGALKELRRVREELLEMAFDDFCSMILRNLGIPPSRELLGEVRSLYFRCFPQSERAGAREVLEELSGAYGLGVISNSMSLAPKRFLEEAGLIGYFKAVVVSGELGYRKPHPRIFERALEELGAGPAEAVHVGNSIEEDVAGAKGVGMFSVFVGRRALDEGAPAEPDLAVGSIREVPQAVAVLNSPELLEIKESLGDQCELCFSKGVCLFKIDPQGPDEPENFTLICPRCRKQMLSGPRLPRPRKHGKYRAIYRRAWLRAHRAKRV